MNNNIEIIKESVLYLLNLSELNELYVKFQVKKDESIYIELVNFLKKSILVNNFCVGVILLDSDNNIIYNKNSYNDYKKFVCRESVFDIKYISEIFNVVESKFFLEYYDTVSTNLKYILVKSNIKLLLSFGSSSLPWKEQINAYYYWQGNFVGSSPKTQYYFNNVSSEQISYQDPNNLVPISKTFNYYGDTIPPNLNTIVLFTGYSNANDVLNNLTNYTTGTNIYSNAMNYFTSNNISNYLISLCFGGGVANTGGWNTGESGAIYSIYQACTKPNVMFSYEESTGNTLVGYGTGKIDYSYNSLTFDIETWDSSSSSTGSNGNDFLNLFNYIKNNPNSNFNGYEMIIIVSIAHSCSNYNGTGQQVISQILSDKTGSYDYISPQLYTQNVGTTVEYCANYNILWTDTGANDNFVYYLNQNKNFNLYGTTMIAPSLFTNNLLNTGGTNDNMSPNLYFYQSSATDSNPPVATASGWKQINYTKDNGVTSFFNNIFQTNSSLGGSVQWMNGDLL